MMKSIPILADLIWSFPVIANSKWFEDIAGREISSAADDLPVEIIAAAQKRGRERDIWQTAAELLAEFQSKV